MLNGLAALAHLVRMLVEPLLDGVENMFGLPPCDPALLAGGALILDGAALHVLAYNLKRVMNILGIGPLIAAMRTA